MGLIQSYRKDTFLRHCLSVTSYKTGWFTRFSPGINRAFELSLSILANLEQTPLQPERGYPAHAARADEPQYFPQALAALIRDPGRLFILWNWKSAWLSIILRGPIFAAATAHRGLRATLAALLTECLYCAVTAGFYGALIQNLRNARPLWLTAIFLTVAVPAVFQVFEAYLHWTRGTPHWRVAEGVSVVVSAVSSLFNWYAMQQGTLLVGREGRTFGSDVRRLPGLLLSFLALLPRRLGQFKRGSDK
jgi:hypothetical protein